MCGILGFSGKKPADSNKIKILTLYNITRGTDATGFAFHDVNKQNIPVMRTFKDVKNAFEYVHHYRNHDVFKKQHKCLIGHTRAKTVGKNTISNAHPFIGNTFTGVHNGTLKNHRYMLSEFTRLEESCKDLKIKKDASDSMILYALMQKVGFVKVIEAFDGAAALVFTNHSGELYCYHNDGRPLHYGRSKEGIYISSEADPLEVIGCHEIKPFDEEVIYKLKDGKILSQKKADRSPMIPPKPKKQNGGANGQSETSSGKVSTTIKATDIIDDTEKRLCRTIGNIGIEVSYENKVFTIFCDYPVPKQRTILKDAQGKEYLSLMGEEGSMINISKEFPNSKPSSCYIYKDADINKHILYMEFDNGDMISLVINKSFINTEWEVGAIKGALPSLKELITSNAPLGFDVERKYSKFLTKQSIELIAYGLNFSSNVPAKIIPISPFKGKLDINPGRFKESIRYVLLDNKFVGVTVSNIRSKTGKKMARPINTKSNIKIMIPEDKLLTEKQYVEILADQYDDLVDTIESKFLENEGLPLYQRFQMNQAILAGMPPLEFLEKITNDLLNILETYELDKELKEKINQLLSLITSQHIQSFQELEEKLNNVKEVKEE